MTVMRLLNEVSTDSNNCTTDLVMPEVKSIENRFIWRFGATSREIVKRAKIPAMVKRIVDSAKWVPFQNRVVEMCLDITYGRIE